MTHDEWLDRWFDGDLSTAELGQFETALKADDLLRRSLVERSLLEAGLIDILSGTAKAAAPKRRRRTIPRTRSWTPFAAAAAALIAAGIVYVATRPNPEPAVVRTPEPVRRDPAPAAIEAEIKEIDARQAEVERRKPDAQDEALRKWEEEIARIKAERAAKERELQAARQKEPEAPKPPPPTQAAIARVTPADGAGYDALPGHKLAGAARIDFADGARVDSDAVAELELNTGRIGLAKGSLIAVGRVAVNTPHAEVAVDGTSRIAVAASTHLEVDAGTARLKRSKDGKSVEVKSGFSSDSADLSLKPLPKEVVVLKFDFDDGKRPASLLEGDVARGPDRRWVLTGTEKRERGTLRRQIAIEQKAGLFKVDEGMVLRFDCWMKGGSGDLSVYFWDATQNANLFIVLKGIRESGWTKVVVKFEDLRIEGDPSRGAKAGDVIGNLLMSVFDEGPAALHIDNLEVVRPRR